MKLISLFNHQVYVMKINNGGFLLMGRKLCEVREGDCRLSACGLVYGLAKVLQGLSLGS